MDARPARPHLPVDTASGTRYDEYPAPPAQFASLGMVASPNVYGFAKIPGASLLTTVIIDLRELRPEAPAAGRNVGADP